MRSNQQNTRTTTARPRPIHAFLAAAILGLAVMPIAFAGAASGPVASKSASLTQQVKSLKQRVSALERKQTTPQTAQATGTTLATPTGPAGGDLTGTYPNPTIGPDKVTGAKVANDSLSGLDIAPDSIFAGDLGPGSVGGSELGVAVVGNEALKDVTAAVGTGVAVAAGTSDSAVVVCPGASMLIAGGYAWQNDQAGTSIIASAPSETIPNREWIVTGHSTQNNTLYAWATCLPI